MQIFRYYRYHFPYFCDIFEYKGIKLQLKGRINGAKRSRGFKFNMVEYHYQLYRLILIIVLIKL